MAKTSAILSDSPLWAAAAALPARADSIHVPLDIAALKPLIPKGFPRGTITEIVGARSSGRTAAALCLLAAATQAGEVCAVVDSVNSFSPGSAQAAGAHLERVLWVRCNQNPDHALRAVDLLLHAGGFGLVWLDLCEVPHAVLNRIPLSYWHRFRRAVENTPSNLLICADSSQVKSSFVNRLELKAEVLHAERASRFGLLTGMQTRGHWQQVSQRQSESLRVEV